MEGQDQSTPFINFFEKGESSNSKSQKTAEAANPDRISFLPDEIILCILSFLPTFFAISTSCLSKRWRNLWTNAKRIDLDDSLLSLSLSLDKARSFSRFGNNVFRLNQEEFIRTFRLNCLEQNCGESTFVHWVSSAAMRNPEEMNIRINVGNPLPLPASIFTCQDLVKLELIASFIVNLPDMVHFPNLKSLSLCLLRFVVDDPTEKFLSGCPLLEELNLGKVTFEILTKLTFNSPTLKRLRVVLTSAIDEFTIIMRTPYLKHLELDSISFKGIETTEMPLLYEAQIKVSPNYQANAQFPDEEFANGMLTLLQNISGVNILKLAWNADVNIRNAFEHLLPSYSNLTRMEMRIYGSWQLMNNFLEYLPNLKVLHCHLVRQCYVNREISRRPAGATCIWEPPISVPRCMSSLQMIDLTLNCCVTEVQVIGYLLQHATMLRGLTIRRALFYVKRWHTTILMELLELPRTSSMCRIHFSPADNMDQ